ncbi:MAG TPA: glycosyltransferase [Steroidobacteraceae bacterium]|nr:glycosyltransferase [Steroidobacteraceae bacterium]
MRIAHVLYSRGFAGSERSTAESCLAQCADHDVLLVIRRDHRDRGGASILDHLDARVQVVEVTAHWRAQYRLQRELTAWRPDIVHAHLRRATRLLAGCTLDAARVATLHLRINGPQFLQMDGLVCISPWQLDTIPAEYQGLKIMIRNSLLPHPRIDAARRVALRAELGADANTWLVGGVGRLARSKGWDILIRAFRDAQLPGARLAILGEGRERARLARLARGLNVALPGFRAQVKDYYQAFDLFVCPSRSEPMGRVIMEALDAGTPVIASDAKGPKEILAEYPGELVPIGDVRALAAALQRAASAPRERLSVDLSAHHLERVSQEMLKFYRDVIRNRNQQRAATSAASSE